MKLSCKLAYSFGAIATALSYQAFATYIIFYYVDTIKLTPYLAALGMLIYAIWNAINDPIAGYVSDHTHSRWGRRLPYIAVGAIPLGLFFYLIWCPPFTEYSQVFPLFLYFTATICLFDGFYTITVLNWSSLFPEMFPSLAERSQVNALRQMFAMIGLCLGLVLPPLIFSLFGWGTMGLILGAVIAAAFLVALWGSHEHLEFSREKQLTLWPSFKASLQNRSFLTFALANLLVQYAFTLLLATTPFFVKYVLRLNAEFTALVLGAAFLVAIPMLFVWEPVVMKVGAKKAYLAAIACLASALLPLAIVQNFGATLLTALFIGVGIAGWLLLSDVLLADVIDEDETRTGTRREGLYFGLNSFISRLAIVLEALSIGYVFTNRGYNPYVYTQPTDFLSGLRWLIAWLPILALGLTFILLLFYPLFGQRLLDMESRVAKIHDKKGVTEHG
ncbi:MFS transporter [Candidatus Saganbacteria bacterium CG08_land_8_20_14_0_20_45_16]|uniref:MFS transporter n=1 Tax=Candidatus Saganbacteria bacterium CG08_land_8_20_14_0_20_45_16 TaxID=2014293 RepID=A0A2H0XYZ0_UNCSA|nr:MAG: MFS transporter [Candidatus Saganbacteria bacterium CG08_land_8_20_14_0_20_45_16]